MDITKKFITRETSAAPGVHFGTVNLTVPDKGWKLDGKPLGGNAVAYLGTYALQCLQDTYAGVGTSVTVDDARKRFAARYDSLIDGTVGLRREGEPAIVQYRRGVVRDKLGPDNRAKYKALEPADRPAFLDNVYGGAPDSVRAAIDKMAERLMAEAEAARKRAAEIAKDLDTAL